MTVSQEKVLAWLVSVEADPARTATLASAGLLHAAAAKDGLVDYVEQGAIDLARRIAELKEEGLVAFTFGLGAMQAEPTSPLGWSGYTLGGILDLRVTMAGKAAVRNASPTLHIETATIGTLNVDRADVNLSLLLVQLAGQIDELDASPDVKDEARTLLESLRRHADTVATGAVGSVISQALLRVLGM